MIHFTFTLVFLATSQGPCWLCSYHASIFFPPFPGSFDTIHILCVLYKKPYCPDYGRHVGGFVSLLLISQSDLLTDWLALCPFGPSLPASFSPSKEWTCPNQRLPASPGEYLERQSSFAEVQVHHRLLFSPELCGGLFCSLSLSSSSGGWIPWR